MNELAAKCTVCNGNSYLWVKLQKLELRKCYSCSHCFTDQSTIIPETYSSDYYLKTHRQWFENPNYELFSTLHKDLTDRNVRSILDAGCGNGDFIRYLSKKGDSFSLYGIDLSPVKESSNPLNSAIFMQGDFLTYPFTTKFDAIVSLAAIEHMENVRAFQKRLHTLLNNNGVAFIMTLNSDGLLYFLANLMRKIGFSFIFKRLYDPHHLNHFNKRSLIKLLTLDNSFVVEKIIDHNAPLKAIDIPVSKGLVRGFLLCGVKIVFVLGKIFKKTYLQTIVVRKQNENL